MSKFNTDKLKLRRAFSLEEIREEEWHGEGTLDADSDESDDNNKLRRHSYPVTPRKAVEDP